MVIINISESTEFDVQAELYRKLKDVGYDVRGEVVIYSDNKEDKGRLDLLIFENNKPIIGVEVKRKEDTITDEQADRYKRILGDTPLLICEGMNRVEETFKLILQLFPLEKKKKKKEYEVVIDSADFMEHVYDTYLDSLVRTRSCPEQVLKVKQNREEITVYLYVLYSAFLEARDIEVFDEAYLSNFIKIMCLVQKRHSSFSVPLWENIKNDNYNKIVKMFRKFLSGNKYLILYV